MGARADACSPCILQGELAVAWGCGRRCNGWTRTRHGASLPGYGGAGGRLQAMWRGSADAVGGGEEVLVAAHVAVGEQAEDEGENEEADAAEEDGCGVVVGTGEDEEGRDRG